jgi:hypothetical protein
MNPLGKYLIILLAALALAGSQKGFCYPEYQAFVEKHSKRTVDCSLCHVNGNGPMGQEPGQEGSLTPAEIERLNKERTAMEPGVDVDSPILNRFGNSIIKTIGRAKFLELRDHPEQLATALGTKSDLDSDGIPDSQEYLDGTDTLNKSHGDPWKLLFINMDRYKGQIILAIVSIMLLDFGFMQLLKGFETVAKARREREAP